MAKAYPAGTVTVPERKKGGLVVVVRDMIHVDWRPEPITFAGKALGSLTPVRERPVGVRVGYYQPGHFVPCAWLVEGWGCSSTGGAGRPTTGTTSTSRSYTTTNLRRNS